MGINILEPPFSKGCKPFEIYKSVVSKSLCKQLLCSGENKKVFSNSIYGTSNIVTWDIDPSRYDVLDDIVHNHYSRYFPNEIPYYLRTHQKSMYCVGDDRTWHVDGLFVDEQDYDKPGMYNHAYFTFVLALNTNYSGGNLEFMAYHNKKFKLSVGDVIAFPAFSWHRVTPVTKGERFSLTMFTGLKKPLLYEK